MIFYFIFSDYWIKRVTLLLQPRNPKYKKTQKKRSIIKFKKKTALTYGSCGLLLLRSLRLSSNQLKHFSLFLKRATRKSDITRRLCWFNCFPHLPLTRKSTGSRMGKGKGKAKVWFACIKGNTILFEFFNLRYGRSLFFMKQISYKLCVPTQKLFINAQRFPTPFIRKKTIFLNFIQ